MKMNATKLTIALVALLLALTCVFAACGKKNETPVDDNPTNVDDNPTVVDTVAKEDLNAIAESLKADYIANYVDLYAPATANEIEAAKSAALINIFAATSKEEAQKVANDFISYLKSQKTIIDSITALVEKIGDVSLKDADALNELTDVVATLDAAYAGNNAAKKAALDAYKADAATQKAIKAIVDRYEQLKDAKKDADVVKGGKYADGTTALEDGINANIAALKADLTKEGKELKLADFNAYTALTKAIADFAEKYALVADTDAYADVFDLTTLSATKKLLDDTFAKDPVLAKMMTVVDQDKALKAAAEEALWREYVYIPAADVKTFEDKKNGFTKEVLFADGTIGYAKQEYKLDGTDDGAYTVPFEFEDGGKYYMRAADDKTGTYGKEGFKAAKFFATEDAAAKQGIENTVKIEVTLLVKDYKLSLKAAVEAAVEAREALNDYTVAALDKYGYSDKVKDENDKDVDGPVKAAVGSIEAIADLYEKSVTRAAAAYKKNFESDVLNNKSNLDLTKTQAKDGDAKNPTVATYSLQDEFTIKGVKLGNNVTNNQKYIAEAITAALNNFVAKSETGTLYDGSDFYTKGGAYIAAEGKKFNLVNGVPAIDYVAWTYRYEYTGADGKAKDAAGLTALDAFDLLQKKDGHAATAKAALRWLKMYIGEGDYADSYDLAEYKDYDKNLSAVFKKNVVLYMNDRAITEVAVPGVAQIRGADVNVAKDETAVDAKLLSAYTVAKALIAEEEKIVAAKAEAVAEVKAAALALREAGDANAVKNANKLLTKIQDGSYLNEKLYDATIGKKNDYLKQDLTNEGLNVTVVVDEKNETKVNVVDLIGEAVAAKNAAETSLNAIEAIANARVGDDKFVTLAELTEAYDEIDGLNVELDLNAYYADLFASYIAEAKRLYDVAAAGENAKVIGAEDKDGKDAKGNLTKDQAEANQRKVQNIAYIFQDYGNFALGVTKNDNYITKADDFALLGGYRTIDEDEHNDLVDRIKDIYDAKQAGDPVYSKKDNKYLTEKVAELTEAFALSFADYKGAAALVATDADAAKVETKREAGPDEVLNTADDIVTYEKAADLADKAIGYFADENAANYINLKVAYAFGDDKVEYDLLSEVYRALTMKKALEVLEKVVDYADEVDKTKAASTELNKENGWKAAAVKRINKLAVSFKEVTSLKAAEEALDSYAADESVYDLSGAIDVILDKAPESGAKLKDLRNFIK